MNRFLSFIVLFIFVLVACSTDDGIRVTPPVATAAATPTAAPTTTAADVAEPATAVTAITLQPVITDGLATPIYLAHAGDDRLFIVEKGGVIRISEKGALLPAPFLDIQDRVNAGGSEQGLLSVAFHPDYAEAGAAGNGRFFVNYTNDDGSTVISRFTVTADPNQADPASETVLLTIPQPFGNHNGGQLQFGPDGYLYAGMGDGGAAGDPQKNGQNNETLLGAMLRLDVDTTSGDAQYGIPADNPFVSGSGRNEIWAIGLRNPWRFSFDRRTGDLFIADVGQNAWEEVDVQPLASSGGENYGWNILEGTHCYGGEGCAAEGTVLPVHEYAHENGRCSITGGYVYRGAQFPALAGNYFFGDYCTGEIWTLTPSGEAWSAQLVLDTDFRLASFGEDVAGELYAVDMQGGIYQIQP